MTFERRHRLPEEPQTEKDKRVLSKLKTVFGALRERSEQTRQQRPVKWILMTPVLIAPLLPLSRIALRNNPVWRDRVFKGLIGFSLFHGLCLMTGFYEDEENE